MPGLKLPEVLASHIPALADRYHYEIENTAHILVQTIILRQIDYLKIYGVNTIADLNNILVDTENFAVHPVDFEEADIVADLNEINCHNLLNQYISQCATIIQKTLDLFKENESQLSVHTVECIVLAVWHHITILHKLSGRSKLSLEGIKMVIRSPYLCRLLPLQNIISSISNTHRKTGEYVLSDLSYLFKAIDEFFREKSDFNSDELRQKRLALVTIFLKHKIIPAQYKNEDQKIEFDLVRTALYNRASGLLSLLAEQNSNLIAAGLCP